MLSTQKQRTVAIVAKKIVGMSSAVMTNTKQPNKIKRFILKRIYAANDIHSESFPFIIIIAFKSKIFIWLFVESLAKSIWFKSLNMFANILSTQFTYYFSINSIQWPAIHARAICTLTLLVISHFDFNQKRE